VFDKDHESQSESAFVLATSERDRSSLTGQRGAPDEQHGDVRRQDLRSRRSQKPPLSDNDEGVARRAAPPIVAERTSTTTPFRSVSDSFV